MTITSDPTPGDRLPGYMHRDILIVPGTIMTPIPTPGDKLRAYAAARGWPQGDLDYLLGVLGEAVLVERERCARLAEDLFYDGCLHQEAIRGGAIIAAAIREEP